MAKSLKEALMEKFADLQQLGIAPTTAPVEDDGPAVTVEMGSDNYGDGGRRQRSNRGGMYDDDRRGMDMPFRGRANRGAPTGPGGRPVRSGERGGPDRGRGGPGAGGERFRRPDRGGERAALEGMPSPMTGPRPPFGDRPMAPRPPFGTGPGGPRPPFGDRPPMGPRPGGPGGPGGPPMGPRPAGPGGPGPMGQGPDLRAQQAAERRRREAGQRDELLALIATHGGVEATPEVYDKFLSDLTVETGALPEIGRVIDAIKIAKSIEAAKVGNAVRALFRRPRPRPAGAPAGGPPRPVAAAAPATGAPVAPAAEASAPAAPVAEASAPVAPAAEASAPAAPVAEASAPVAPAADA